MPARKKKAPLRGPSRPSRSGPNIPDAQRGERGELLQVRVTRGTVALLEKLARERSATKGAIVEMALITLQHVPEE